MATTGTYSFDPTLDEAFAEAFERAGVAPDGPGGSHLKSMFRSLRYMLNSEWSLIGIRQWMIQQGQEVLDAGDVSFTLPVGAIDITEAVLSREGRVSEMYPMSRNEYLNLVDKTLPGRPDRYFVDRQAGTMTVYFWRAAENSSDIILYNYFRQMQDVGDELTNTLQLPTYAQEAMVAGLAARLAQKFNYGRFKDLWAYYWGPDINTPGGCVKRLREEDRERSDLELMVVMEPRTARR